MTPQTVNAYYNPAPNEIVLPAAILQPPLFDADADAAANYGGIGAFIGHEIGHAFDDAAGVPRARCGRSSISSTRTARSAGMHVNGELTLGENVGDLGGLSLAYQAYVLSLDGQPRRSSTASPATSASFWAGRGSGGRRSRDEYLRQRLLSVAHAPPQYRANGPVGNLPAFYAAFHVQPGDKLYRDPSQRVVIW